MDINEALKTALDNEQKGQDIYKEAANKTKNPIVEKTFRYLADQEAVHIKDIKKYLETKEIESKEESLEKPQAFFSMTVKEFKDKTELSDDDIKAHETALELEKKAHAFYKEQHDKVSDEELRKFLKWLMDQENAHYVLIQKTYDFIKDPVHFYSEEEAWMADGG